MFFYPRLQTDFFHRAWPCKLLSSSLLCLKLLAISSASSYAADTTQAEAQRQAEALNKRGSDQSMEGATTSAMKALMHLSESQYSQAFSNGYKAYGQYTNSTDLDDMAAQNKNLKNSLTSTGGKTAQSGTVTRTSFRRLDSTFLNRGEAGKVAAEFEQKSGMKRKDFLNILSAVSEQDLFSDDPNVIAKSFAKFDQFTKAIPNKAFREKLEHNVNKIPESIRSGALVKALANLTPPWANNNFKKDASPIHAKSLIAPQPIASAPTATAAESAPSPPPPEIATVENVNPVDPNGRDPASELVIEGAEKRMVGLKYDNMDPFLAALVESTKNAAKVDAPEKSLFEQVSSQYRSLEERLH